MNWFFRWLQRHRIRKLESQWEPDEQWAAQFRAGLKHK